MLVVATTAHVGLNFCLCENTFFSDSNHYFESPSLEENEATQCCSSCHSCTDTAANTLITEDSSIKTSHCKDCIVKFNWHFDPCVPSFLEELKTASDTEPKEASEYQTLEKSLASSLFNESIQIRGSPPMATPHSPIPVYQRHSVYLI